MTKFDSSNSSECSKGVEALPTKIPCLTNKHLYVKNSSFSSPTSVTLRSPSTPRRFERNLVTQSVYSSHPNNQLISSLLQTNSLKSSSISPLSPPSEDESPKKPRPVSCYSSTSPFRQNKMSKIPKRVSSKDLSPSLLQIDEKNGLKSNVEKLSRTNGEKGLKRVDKLNEGSRKRERSRDFIRPRLVTIVRSGMKPRRVCRYLLNQKTARSFEQVLSDITHAVQPAWGAVRKVFNIAGEPVETLEDFFKELRIFIVYPSDKTSPDDFFLESDEVKHIHSYMKIPASAVKESIKDGSKVVKKSPKVSNSERSECKAYPTHPKYLSVSTYSPLILSAYRVGEIIGDGNFAVVRHCVDKVSNTEYALKIIDKTKLGLDSPHHHEVTILQTLLPHPNIITYFFQHDFKNELFLFMEYISGGDLFDTIAKFTKFTEDESRRMTSDIASALTYLHSMQIVHRDIKPENLLVHLEAKGVKRLKLCDFGLAQFVEPNKLLFTVCGTPTYVAPEILSESGYGLKVDVWALGIILYILLCGYPPFVSSTGEQEDLFDLILIGDYEFPPEQWDNISEDGKDLIMRMIESDVDIRLEAHQVISHPWLSTDPDEREERRKLLYKNDFNLSVFEKMGLTKLNICLPPSSKCSTSTSLEKTNSIN